MNLFQIVQQIIRNYRILKPIITDIIQIYTKNKDKKEMDKKLYYEVPVTTSNDIKNAYQYAVSNNIKFYRCIAKDGSIYGWDGSKYIKAKEGQKWFEHPEYKEHENTVDPHICLNERFFEEENVSVKEVALNAEKPTETAEEVVKTDIIDYKALYEQAYALLNEKQKELDEIKNAFYVFAKELRLAADKIEQINTEE